jgi:hypothetical protein
MPGTAEAVISLVSKEFGGARGFSASILWYTLLYRARSGAAANIVNSFSYPAFSTTLPAFEK